MENEGSWGEWFHHRETEWVKDAQTYHFGEVSVPPLTIRVCKAQPKTIEISVSGPFPTSLVFQQPIPRLERSPGGRRALHISLMWQLPHVSLSLQGKEVAEASFSPHDTALADGLEAAETSEADRDASD